MCSAQARLAGTIDTFYNAADATSDGAMAGNAYKRSVEELDNAVSREFVSLHPRSTLFAHSAMNGFTGHTISDDSAGTCREDVLVLPHHQ